MRSISLDGQWAVVTGASRGLGAAIMSGLADCGANVIACARSDSSEFKDLRTALEDRHGVSIVPIMFDLADTESVKQAARTITSRGHSIDILVNNAGVASGSLFQMTPIAEMRRVFEVNFFGLMAFTQPISRSMSRTKKGAIVNIASTSGLRGDTGTLSYGSSKAALAFATKVLAQELAEAGIRVNAVAPGITRTDMFDEMEPKARDLLIAAGAMNRPAEPDEVVGAVLYLVSDLSSHVTGQVLRVDGGQI